MATKSSTANVGTRRGDGSYPAGVSPSGAAAHVTVSFDDTQILNKDQLMAACKAIADQLFQK